MIFLLWALIAIILYNVVFKYFMSLFRIGNIGEKAIVITGCDSGFGRKTALRCVRHGFLVFAGCLTEQGQICLKNEADGASRLHTFFLDVCEEDSITNARKFVENNLGTHKLHALINNAGTGGAFAPDAWCSISLFKQVMQVNFFSLIRVTHEFSPLLKRDRGRIINMASVNGPKIALPFTAPYSASKSAVNAYSDILRHEMRQFGVKVIILEPSFYKTPLMDLKPLNDKIDKMYAECHPDEKQFYGKEYVDFLKDSLREIDVNFCSPNIQEVVDAYFDALTTVWPKLRYHPGLHSKSAGFVLPSIDYVRTTASRDEIELNK